MNELNYSHPEINNSVIKEGGVSFQKVIGMLPQNIWIIKSDGEIVYINENFASAFKFDEIKNKEKNVYQICRLKGADSKQIEMIRKNDKEAMAESHPLLFIEDAWVNGELKCYLSFKQSYPLSDGIGLLGISVDITERRKLEKELIRSKESAESVNEAKTRFIHGIRHDLMTPLSNFLGLAEILAEMVSNDEQKAICKDMITSARDMHSLVSELIEFADSKDAQRPVQSQKMQIKDFFYSIHSMHKQDVLMRGLSFQYQYDDELPESMVTDELRLKRITSNLITNAIKYTSTGGISLKLSNYETYNAKFLCITVKDTGCGIDPKYHDDIFDAMSRIHKEDGQGLGLGLNIVKQFVEDLEGDIKVSSQLGYGSSFIVYIPYFYVSSERIH